MDLDLVASRRHPGLADEVIGTTWRRNRCQLWRPGRSLLNLLIKALEEASESTKIVGTLYNRLAEPFEIEGQIIDTTFSIGIALNHAEQSNQAETLMQDAHRAMSRARTLGKERYEIFDPGMRTEAVKRFQLEAELRHAIDNKEFMLYYQPIVNLKTGNLAGFEALVRWQHPQQGFVSPGAFIPAAEDTGLIIPMGIRCLRKPLRIWWQKIKIG